MKRFALLILFAMLGLFGWQARVQAEGPPGLLARVAAYDGNTLAMTLVDDVLYTSNGVKISVYDVSAPAQPRHLADSPPMPEVVRDVAVAGDFLFVADGAGGLWIFRIQSDHTLTWGRQLFGRAVVDHVETMGNRAYVTRWNQGENMLVVLEIVGKDVTTVGSKEVNAGTLDMAAAKGVLFLADHSQFLTYDVSNPQNIRELGRFHEPSMEYFLDMEVADGVAYINAQDTSAGPDSALITVDVSDPASPRKLAYMDLPFIAGKLALRRPMLFITGGLEGVQLYDVSEPASPQRAGAYEARAAALLAMSDLLVISPGLGDISLVDIRDPAAPQPAGRIFKWPAIERMVVQGQRLYVTGPRGEFRIYDLSDIQRPQLLGADDANAYVEDFVVAGDYVFQTYYRWDPDLNRNVYGLRVLDISDPARPQEAAFYPLTVDPHHIAYARQRIYLATDMHLLVFDVSQPTQPRLLSFALSAFTLNDIQARDDVVYATEKHRGLSVWDVSDDYLPQEMAWLFTPGRTAWEFDMAGDRAIVADGRGGLAFVNVAQPDDPHIETALTCDAIAQNVAVSGNRLFAVCHDMNVTLSLHAYDVRQPDRPREQAVTVLSRRTFNLYHSHFHALAATDEWVFFNGGDAGLQVYRYLSPDVTQRIWLPSLR